MTLNKKFLCGLTPLLLLLLLSAFQAFAADAPERTAKDTPAMRKWIHENHFADKGGDQRVDLKATYYSAEYIESLVNAEAEKNMWTADELENYKYTLFKTLNLNDSIAFNIEFNVTGVPMYAQPFDRHITLLIGKKKYTPSDYDHRFNFKISGQRDGMVYFPRYDPQTGEDLLKGVKQIRLVLDGAISHAISRRGDVTWIWDITKDNPERLNAGKAADRLEIDRLLKRVEKLNKDKQDLQSKLDAVNKELSEINSRINELQSK